MDHYNDKSYEKFFRQTRKNNMTTFSRYMENPLQKQKPVQPVQIKNVKKRELMFNALFVVKPMDFGNALYNYACFNNIDEIIQHIDSFSTYEKYHVIKKLEEKNQLGRQNDWLMRQCWGETKTDIDEQSGVTPNSEIRNKLLNNLFFSKEELGSLEKNLEKIKVYLKTFTNNHKIEWFRKRAPIFSNILTIFNEFSNVELMVLYEKLLEQEKNLSVQTNSVVNNMQLICI